MKCQALSRGQGKPAFEQLEPRFMLNGTLYDPVISSVSAELLGGNDDPNVAGIAVSPDTPAATGDLTDGLAGGYQAMAADQNLVLSSPYDYYPSPTYSTTTDAGDITQLTDGYKSGSGSMWVLASTVGWIEGVNIPVVIHFDLGQEASLSEVRFYSAVSDLGTGVAQVGLDVYVSLDDLSYVLAGQRPAPPVPDSSTTRQAVRMDVPLDNVRARHVAIVAMAPVPFYFVFVDEIEIMGQIPADPGSVFPTGVTINASGAQGLQESLEAQMWGQTLLESLTIQMEDYMVNWPVAQANAQRDDLAAFAQGISTDPSQYESLRAVFTEQQRIRAGQIYATDLLVWEEFPDVASSMLSLSVDLSPTPAAEINTAINALEATALGIANLSDTDLALGISIVDDTAVGAPAVSFRIGRYFKTTNAKYVPDVLLDEDASQTIPSGESRLVWLEADSTNASPGAYSYQVTVEIGAYSQVIDLTVQVHDVTLDTETPLSVGNWSSTTSTMTAAEELRAEMLDHRQTTAELGGTSMILPLLDAYGEPLRPVQINLTSLARELAHHQDFNQVGWCIAFDRSSSRPQREMFGSSDWMSAEFQEIFGEWIAAVVACLQANGRSYDEFYLQFFDETLVDVAAEITALTKSFDPNVRVMLTIPRASIAATQKQVDAGLDISAYHAPRIEYDNPQDGFPMLSSGGRELWFYNAGGAEEVGRECDPLTWYRYMYWSAFYHGATGVHFWTLVRESPGTGGWDETNQVYYLPMIYLNTDQQNLPPDVVTAEVVIPSRRWEYSRMGTEDYMLLKMAQDKIDELGAAGNPYRNQLRRIIRDVITHRENRILFRAKRRELVELVEKLAAR